MVAKVTVFRHKSYEAATDQRHYTLEVHIGVHQISTTRVVMGTDLTGTSQMAEDDYISFLWRSMARDIAADIEAKINAA